MKSTFASGPIPVYELNYRGRRSFFIRPTMHKNYACIPTIRRRCSTFLACVTATVMHGLAPSNALRSINCCGPSWILRLLGWFWLDGLPPGKGIDPTEPCWVGRERRFRSLILGLFNVVRGLLRYQRNVCLCCIKWSKSTAPDRRLSCPFKNLVKNWSPSRPLVHELRQTQ